MKYKVVKCAHPRNPSKVMYQLQPVYDKNIDCERFCQIISQRTSLVPADCLSVLRALSCECSLYLPMSYALDFGPLGVISTSISSRVELQASDVGRKSVQKIRVKWRMSRFMKRALADVRLNKA